MNDVIIRAEALGKRYYVGHRSADRERYTALRDVIGRSLRGLGRSAMDMMNGRQIVAGDTVEEFWALKDVSFEIRRGEVVGIIGRNGAGKSTLLKVLSRITEPSEGRVEIRGRVASLLEVGTGFHPELTGRENIYLNGAILGMSREEIRRKFDEIVDFAEVERFLDTPVKRYSSGMYVRLAFAVAAHLEPEILIVDEVLAVGDAEFQQKCLGKMKDVAGHGRTVLFVSHNMTSVKSLSSSGILLNRGFLEQAGTCDDVIRTYVKGTDAESHVEYCPDLSRPAITKVSIDPEALAHDKLRVEIYFRSPIGLKIPIGGLTLKAATGEPVWGSSGRFHTRVAEQQGLEEGRIVCEVKNIPLLPGDYLLSVWLSDWHTDYDWKLDCLRLKLGEDKVNLLRPPTSAIGHLDWNAEWTSEAS